MSTAGRRNATWTNSDGLVVGFGTNEPPRDGATQKNEGGLGGVKVASVFLNYQDMNACNGAGGTVNVPLPAGSRVVDVRFVCHTTWTSTGTNTAEIGLTGGDTDGFMTTTQLTTANLTEGAVLLADGVFMYDDTADGDTTAAELKSFATADTVDLLSNHADWTGGTASIVVSYV